MEPIPETSEALRWLALGDGEDGLRDQLRRTASLVRTIVPDCIGLSLASMEHGVTFTLVATDADIAVLDAVQYLMGGPCGSSAHRERPVLMDEADLLDEAAWREFAAGSAAKAVRSTLTLPQLRAGRVVGTVNLYAGAAGAFEGLVDRLAEMLGAWAPGAIANADLSFSSRTEAEQAPRTLQEQGLVARAVGVIAARDGTDVLTAQDRLRDAAERAGISEQALARLIVDDDA